MLQKIFSTQNLILLIIFLVIIFTISVYKRPTIEHFEASQTASVLESKAQQDKLEAEQLRKEANTAAEKCKQIGVVFPEAFQSLDSFLNGQRQIISQSLIPVFQEGNTMTVVKSTTELASFDLKANIQDILNFKIPIPLSEPDAQKVEETKLKLAKALAAEAQAQASSKQAEAAREQVQTQTVTIQDIPVSETTKNDPSVQAAKTKVEETVKVVEELTKAATEANARATEVASDSSSTIQQITASQKDVDKLVADAAKAAAEAAAAKVELVSSISKIETSPESQQIIQSVLETDKKVADAATSMAIAAEAKAEVSKAQADLASVEKKISESATETEKIKMEEDKLSAEEELRRKLTASDFAAAEAQRKKAEQMQLEAELEEKRRKEAEERRLYAIDTINKLLQKGIIQTNDSTYNAILEANTNGDIDTLAESITTTVQMRKAKELQRENRFNERLKELNEVRQGRAILSLEDEQAILNLENEEEFQQKKQEVKKMVDDLIRRNQEESQRKIDEMNRIQAEKEKEALAKLMAMSPTDRATAQMNEAAKKQEELKSTANSKFDDYKNRVLNNLVSKNILTNEQKELLVKLPTYEDFDKQVRAERMKTETSQQKLEREEEERKFEAYKAENIDSLLKSDNIFGDTETINKLRNASNYDQFTELTQLEFHRKKQDYFNEIAQGRSAQEMALFAQNMEPTRKQIVEQAFSDRWITKEQYERLLITSINTPQKFEAVENEIKQSKQNIINQREAETQRKIEAAMAEQRAIEEAERQKKLEEQRQVQQFFLERRASEVDASSRGMFGLTKEQQQDLLSTDDRMEFIRKKEKYLFDNLGCCIREGEDRASFFNRRQDEELAKRAAKEREERETRQNRERIESLFRKAQENIDSNNRFWQADGQRDLTKLNELKARNLSDKEFLAEYETWMNKVIEDLRLEQQRKLEEQKRKDEFYATLDLDKQPDFLTAKNADDLDVRFYRIPSKRMGFSAGFLYKKTAQECADEFAKDSKAISFDRQGHAEDDREECSKTTSPYWWNVRDAEKNQSMYVRQDMVGNVPGVDPKTLADANTAAAAFAVKKEELEMARKATPEAIQKLLGESQLLTIGGVEYRAFPGYVMDEKYNIHSEWTAMDNTNNVLQNKGAKAFSRDMLNNRGALDVAGNQRSTSRQTLYLNTASPFRLGKDGFPGAWRSREFATYIPVANLPPEFRTSGFTDYTNVFHQTTMAFPPTVNSRYMTNQNRYTDRSSRMLNYSLFHPAL